MSTADAKRAVEIGCTGIVVSNHGGRQLDGSRASFDQLAAIVDAVGDRIDVLMDGGVQRGSHVLKALSVGAKAVGVGRYYLYPLAAAGQAGIERALGLMVVLELAKFSTHPSVELLRKFKVDGVKKRPRQVSQIHDGQHRASDNDGQP
jgi:isopentenyl diphosphate isomerase/L-lactate dehydrogenase-like FMN-dependent dehydrogenase